MGRGLTKGRKEPPEYQGGAFQKEGTASAKATRQNELGMTRGEQAGQHRRVGGSTDKTMGLQAAEGTSRPRGWMRPLQITLLSALEMRQGTRQSLPSESWPSKTSEFPFSMTVARWKVCRDGCSDERL